MSEEIQQENIEQPQSLEKSFEEDEVLPQFDMSMYKPKSDFVQAQTVVVTSVKMNQWGKPLLIYKIDDQKFNTPIGRINYEKLRQKFGNKIADWKNKEVTLEATPFAGDPQQGINAGHLLNVN